MRINPTLPNLSETGWCLDSRLLSIGQELQFLSKLPGNEPGGCSAAIVKQPLSKNEFSVFLQSIVPDLELGEVEETGNPLDFAVEGNENAFFVVLADNGEILLTRDGRWHVNEQGVLVNVNGQPILDVNNNTIPLDTEQFAVTPDGGIEIEGQERIQIKVTETARDNLAWRDGVRFGLKDPNALETAATGTYAVGNCKLMKSNINSVDNSLMTAELAAENDGLNASLAFVSKFRDELFSL
ncbi:MAG: hypothetical protein LBJ83_01360 [Oscillospiraceae bacterium]|jgi:flagellar basal body rod protein FlgG|nr:hypothetical protein [Oscillospiraceae bacterium]